MRKLSDINTIRIIITQASGLGHQTAAITAMKKLRALGFTGVFDIRYHENESFTWIKTYTELYTEVERVSATSQLTGFKVAVLINGYKPNHDEIDLGVTLEYTDLGNVTITRLPYKCQNYDLPFVELTLCAGDDSIQQDKMIYRMKYCTEKYIGLQPTAWDSDRFTVSSTVQPIDRSARLSSDEKNIYIPSLTDVETKIMNICYNENCNTQLLYALGAKNPTWGCVDRASQLERLMDAHRIIEDKQKATVLIIPYALNDFNNFAQHISDIRNIHFIDLKNSTLDLNKFNQEAIIFVFTGPVCRELFHKLLGPLTTYPPIIEGCNTIDFCESNGLPYIVGSRMIAKNNPYEISLSTSYKNELNKHCEASICLSNSSDEVYRLQKLASYMQDSSESKNKAYHEARQGLYFSRPDAVEASLKQLGYAHPKVK